jgi:hypothetical protein
MRGMAAGRIYKESHEADLSDDVAGSVIPRNARNLLFAT